MSHEEFSERSLSLEAILVVHELSCKTRASSRNPGVS
jgi:hypothetical protein